jgi:hypothetical protein
MEHRAQQQHHGLARGPVLRQQLSQQRPAAAYQLNLTTCATRGWGQQSHVRASASRGYKARRRDAAAMGTGVAGQAVCTRQRGEAVQPRRTCALRLS